MNITPSGTHCWLCGRHCPPTFPVCPCYICQENYKRTGEYQPQTEVWKPDETQKTDAS